MNDQTIEQGIQANGLIAPRVTPEDVEANIATEHYFTAEHGIEGAVARGELWARDAAGVALDNNMGRITFCVLVLRNGASVVGINYGAIDPARHSAEIGRHEARAQAVEKVWELLGFRLRDRLTGGQ